MKKYLKYAGIGVEAILVLLMFVISIEYILSYNEKSFNIPDDYFDLKYEDKTIDSENNGYKEYFQYILEVPKSKINWIETQEDYNHLSILKEYTEGAEIMSYYSNKYLCEKTGKSIDCNNYKSSTIGIIGSYYSEYSKEHEIEFDYNGQFFKKFEKYLDYKYGLFKQIKSKEYIKYDLVIHPSVQGDLELTKAVNEIVLTSAKNGDYQKAISILTKFLEINRVTQDKMFNTNTDFVISEITKANIYNDCIERLLEDFEDIPKQLLKQLLTELEKTTRYGLAADALRVEYRENVNYISKEILEIQNKDKNKLMLKLFYSDTETKAIYKKIIYENIENEGNIYKSNFVRLIKNNPDLFTLKNVTNFVGRYNINKLIPSNYIEMEELAYHKRIALAEKTKNKINTISTNMDENNKSSEIDSIE